jgi:hypothetical protein
VVLQELRKGYLLNGELLRPAQVIVGAEKEDKEAEEKAQQELVKGDYM